MQKSYELSQPTQNGASYKSTILNYFFIYVQIFHAILLEE